ncbi:TOMM precursor leader peptide-binding protein [Kitasatospora sp. NPDC056531]|uniref:TOMM precursor leader peptide-binding protein n=1 Tax=Kitasatospora sp. NPDC056531 TaxID=3345856 RepID=UPI0036CAAB02
MTKIRLAADAALFDDSAEAVVYRSNSRSGFALRGLWGQLLGDVWDFVSSAGAADTDELAGHLAERGVDREEALEFITELTKRGALTTEEQQVLRKEPLTSVALAGMPGAVDLLRDLLSAGDHRRSDGLSVVDWEAGRAVRPSQQAVVVIGDASDVALFKQVNREAMQSGSHFLSAMVGDGVLTVGPTVIPGGSACFQCFWTRRTMEDDVSTPTWIADARPRAHGASGDGGAEGAASRGMLVHMAAAMLVAEIERLRLSVFAPALVSKVAVLSEATLRSEVHAVFPVPACPSCALADQAGQRGGC